MLVQVPAVRSIGSEELWLERPDWSDPPQPTDAATDAYIAALFVELCRSGTIIATGQPHTTTGGHISCEDLCVVARLEADERAALVHAVAGVINSDAQAVYDGVTAVCRDHPADLDQVVRQRSARGSGIGHCRHDGTAIRRRTQPWRNIP